MPGIGLYDVSTYDDAYYADESSLNWELDCDFNRDGVYDESLTVRMAISVQAKWGMDDAWQEVASPGEATFILDNGDNNLSPDNALASYLTKLVPGCLMRLRAMYQGVSYTRYVGRFHHMSVQPGGAATLQDTMRVTLHVTDPINELIAGEYSPPFLTTVRVDQALQRMFDSGLVPWPYDGSFWVFGMAKFGTTAKFFKNTLCNFEAARTTLAFSGDVAETGKQRGVQPYGFISDIVAAEAGGRFWWDAPTAQFKFHNRYHDALNAVVAAIPTAITSVDPDDIHYGDDIANVIIINYVPRKAGTPGSLIANADNVPIRLTGGQSLNVTLRYRDPSNPSARVAAKDVITPVLGTDIIANANSDGSGANRTSVVGMAVTIGATSTAVTLTNGGKTDLYITTLQVRGTPYTTYNAEAATAQSARSIALYNRRPKQPRQISTIDDAAFANAYAKRLLARYSEPRTRIGAITVTAVNPADVVQALTLGVGDRITVNDSFSGHAKGYVIIGVTTMATAAENAVRVRWTLQPYEGQGLFIFGKSRFGIDTLFAL